MISCTKAYFCYSLQHLKACPMEIGIAEHLECLFSILLQCRCSVILCFGWGVGFITGSFVAVEIS